MNSLNAPAEVIDGTGLLGSRVRQGRNEYLYAIVPANALKGETYVVTYDGDEESCPKLVVAATLAVYQEYAVVLVDQGATAGVAKVQTKGHAYMLVEGTTDVAKTTILNFSARRNPRRGRGSSFGELLRYCVRGSGVKQRGSHSGGTSRGDADLHGFLDLESWGVYSAGWTPQIHIF